MILTARADTGHDDEVDVLSPHTDTAPDEPREEYEADRRDRELEGPGCGPNVHARRICQEHNLSIRDSKLDCGVRREPGASVFIRT